MIVRIVGITGMSEGAAERGYMALRRDNDGEWVPIRTTLVASSNEAIERCIADTGQRLADLEEIVSRGLGLARVDIARLRDRPRSTDRVRVGGRLYEPDEDGAIRLPDRIAADEPPRPVIDVEIDDPVFKTLHRALQLEVGRREAAESLMIDSVLNQPLELLVAVARAAPDMLGEVAELMARIGVLEDDGSKRDK